MEWLVPAVAATLSNSAILAVVYLYLWLRERERSLGILFLSWAIYTLRFVFMLLYVRAGSTYLLAANQALVLLSSHLILSGFRLWTGKSAFPVPWTIATAAAFVWLAVAAALRVEFTFFAIPVFVYSGWIFVWTGVLVLRNMSHRETGSMIVGITLIVWGVHKMDYPFLRPVEWFAPWGYLLGAIVAVITGVGMVLIYFERTRDDLAAAVRERETLFREVHHRVKNNLQIVNGLLELQKSAAPGVTRSLLTVQSRVASMSLLHEQLYRSGGLAAVDSTDYLDELVERVAVTLSTESLSIDVNRQIDSIVLPMDVAIPLGLIVNELMSNAAKHAFAGRSSGAITVGLARAPSRKAVLSVEDNGVGFTEPPRTSEGVGWQLVRSLSEQIGGSVEIRATDRATTRVTVAFPCPGGVGVG